MIKYEKSSRFESTVILSMMCDMAIMTLDKGSFYFVCHSSKYVTQLWTKIKRPLQFCSEISLSDSCLTITTQATPGSTEGGIGEVVLTILLQ